MTTAVFPISRGIAKNDTADTCGKNRSILRSNAIIADTARKVWPVKTTVYLQQITGYSTRSVEGWLAGSAKIPSDALASLLRSEFGQEFLAAIMADAKPGWWKRLAAYTRTINATVQQRKLQRELREALLEESETSAAIARADALLVQDADFYGANASAVHAMAGLSHRSVAPTIKRGR